MWTSILERNPALLLLAVLVHAQGAPPGKAEVSHVGATLKELAKELAQQKVKSVALTKLACGVGGLSWDSVKPLIEKHLGECETQVFVYEEFRSGVKAAEA